MFEEWKGIGFGDMVVERELEIRLGECEEGVDVNVMEVGGGERVGGLGVVKGGGWVGGYVVEGVDGV